MHNEKTITAEISSKSQVIQAVSGGGSAGELIRKYDWSKTALGTFDKWPQSLRSALGICINSNFPIAIYWGKELVLLYNDAWSPIPGIKHPWALGKPAAEVWPEIWNDIHPQFQKAFSGIPGGSKDALLPMQRHGYTEECYFDFTFTPIYGESGKVEGIFNAVIETTYRVISERRSGLLQRISDAINSVTSKEAVIALAGEILDSSQMDIPFYCICELTPHNKIAVSRSSEGFSFNPNQWSLNSLPTDTISHFDNLKSRGIGIIQSYWPEASNEAVVCPLRGIDGTLHAYLIAGVSARRKYDRDYKSFFESLSTVIAGELNTIKSLDEQTKRAEALAQIDKAKTEFFSNISHEFRTPLTLMLGPLQTVLEDQHELKEEHRSHLTLSYRNTLRLQKLVNTLLDFSRIEAGRIEASIDTINLSELTRDLAGSFRSAIEHAGLQYEVLIQSPELTANVDVDMYEKIVLNLISNAFKYTASGRIRVELKQIGSAIELSVSDTGIGISAQDVTKIFERFYRVNTAQGRSQEGTGIGLSMVKELVTLMNGEIRVASQPGAGTTFTVSFLAAQHGGIVNRLNNGNPSNAMRESFIRESQMWDLPQGRQQSNPSGRGEEKRSKILLADDNQDMREYINRLLQKEFEVINVTNGEDAFLEAVGSNPDLIISDIMMPKLDGFGLLKKLRETFQTRNIPVLFLSARAGEEAKVDGIRAGADDYLVKPFSAKELVARVANHISINRARRQTEKEFFNLFLQSPAHIHVMRGPDHVMEFFHPLGKKFIGRDITGMKIREALPEVAGQGYFEMLDQVYYEGKEFYLPETKAKLQNSEGIEQEYYFNITYLPWRNINGKIQGVLQFTFDVTEQAKARKKIEEAEYNLQNAVELAELGTWHIDLLRNYVTYSPRVADWWGLPEDGDSLDAVINCMHADDREKVAKAVQQAIDKTGFYAADYRLYNAKTGQERYISANGKVFKDENNKPVRMSGIVRDITMERIAQQELERLVGLRTKELSEANIALQRSNEELGQFAYVASHDLQEPLRKIQTFSDLAKNNLNNTEVTSSYLDKIDNSAARMSSLIKDVLLYSQVNNQRPSDEIVDLNLIFDNVKTDLELVIQQKNAVIELDRLPKVKGNGLQLYQLFSNLINNSLKFSDESPLIKITYTKSSLPESVANHEMQYHLITVQDNGIGFDNQYAGQIFQLFNRLHNRKDYGGTGIGLALSKKIVENHKGHITASSSRGNGAEFKIYLPIK